MKLTMGMRSKVGLCEKDESQLNESYDREANQTYDKQGKPFSMTERPSNPVAERALWNRRRLVNPILLRHSVETYPETSSHATCQGTFGHSRLNSLSHCGLILA